LAWTISDLDGLDRPTRAEIDEAIQLRMGEGSGKSDWSGRQ
jgi:hypothetical protein